MELNSVCTQDLSSLLKQFVNYFVYILHRVSSVVRFAIDLREMHF